MFHPQPSRPSSATARAEPACADPEDDLYLLPRAIDAADPPGDVTPTPAPEAALPELLSTGQVAAYFGRDARTIRRWKSRGILPAVSLFEGGVFYRLEDIRRLVSDRLVGVILKPSRAEKTAKEAPKAGPPT